MLPSSVPSAHGIGEFSGPYKVKSGLSWRNRNEQKGSNHILKYDKSFQVLV